MTKILKEEYPELLAGGLKLNVVHRQERSRDCVIVYGWFDFW